MHPPVDDPQNDRSQQRERQTCYDRKENGEAPAPVDHVTRQPVKAEPYRQPSRAGTCNQKHASDKEPFWQIKHMIEYSAGAVLDQCQTDAEMMMPISNSAANDVVSEHLPLDGRKTLDMYFLKARAATLDIAAMLDRLSRSEQACGAIGDIRKDKLRMALRILTDTEEDKARRIQEIFSVKG